MYYYVLLCIIMYYYVLLCIIMYYYVLLCIIAIIMIIIRHVCYVGWHGQGVLRLALGQEAGPGATRVEPWQGL